ncbi:MAG TPA: hypothetical protein DEA22_05830 [Blastocatellia bacterium]|nr:hypothetical protein [Blastocatellia bacterium]
MKKLNEKDIRAELQSVDLSPIKIAVRGTELYTTIPGVNERNYRPDLIVELVWLNTSFRFVAEIKAVATPKLVSSAIAELRQYTDFVNSNGPEKYYPLIAATYLNEKLLETLASQNISGIDLSGNMVLVIPETLYVFKIGKPNRFPTVSSIKNVYRGSSSLVVRALLSGGPFPTVKDILEGVQARGGTVSLGTVSKVLTRLEEDFILMRDFGISVSDPNTLLANLRKNYIPPQASKRIAGKAANVPDALQSIAANYERFGGLYAIDQPQRYVNFPVFGLPLKVYVENIADALNGIDFEETSRFADIELIETNEKTVYFDRNLDRSTRLFYTSPLEVYLSLARGDKREQDISEQMAEQIIAKCASE